MEEIQHSITKLMDMYQEQMSQFESELKQASASSNAPPNLASQFASFKTFIMQALNNLQRQVEMLAENVDHLEMYSRRKILLFHGVAEVKNEDTSKIVAKVVADQLKIPNFTTNDIRRCHRMGRLDSHKQRPILVKFIDLSIRNKVWFAKTNLKGTGTTVSEFLTKMRHNVFLAARHKFGINKCWTREGSVYVVSVDGSRHRINSLSDLRKIPQEDILQEELTKTSTAKIMAAAPKSKRLGATKK
ncbi:hypothetical protein K1T71_009172 [Dendrolimus kikuchii]|uniref:Uncharacterized protein n=2 Tax=Dendrolimus kikuchii TaxID=765133 RepID=A0ACC1CGK0_9NEOP|nr:hypothetical protein K1T71_013471 [Dendrolimus kikuchii]KAJ0175031.1 hypothetical protein K1T71_009172 [Dendrolimus kikuchii]